MRNLDKLKELRPEIVDKYMGMDKEQLLDKVCGESFELIKMEERVEVLMNNITFNSVGNNLDIESIIELIEERKDCEKNSFCASLIWKSDELIIETVSDLARKAWKNR